MFPWPLLGENRESVEAVLSIGRQYARERDDANRIASRLGIMRYLHLANQVRRLLPAPARLVDLGGGYGQVALFLREWGYDVTVFEIRPHYEASLKRLGLRYLMRPDGDLSAFADGSLDGVVEVAVLELIDDKPGFVRRARRLLRDGGLYFCFLFPNRGYWMPRLGLRGSSPYSSPREFASEDVARFFTDEGFGLLRVDQFQFLPMNRLRVNHLVSGIWGFDRLLCRCPGLRLLSGSFNLTLRKEG